MWCRSGNSKNRKHRKYECLIPFKRCGSGKACSGIADFPRTMEQFAPLPQGLHSGKWAWSAFPSVCDLGLLVCVREHCACMLKHAHTCTGLEIQVISPGKRYKCKPASCLTRLKSCLPILFQYSCCPDNFEVSYPFGSGLKCFDT